MLTCILSSCILVLVIALVLYLIKWVVEVVTGQPVPIKIQQIAGIILVLIFCIRLLECTKFIPGMNSWLGQ